MSELFRIVEKQDRKLARAIQAKAAKHEHRIALKAARKDLRVNRAAMLDS